MSATLIICPHYPLPESTGANLRTMHFARYFHRLGPVDIAHILPRGDAKETGDLFREVLSLPYLSLRFRHRFLLGLFSGRPPAVYRYQAGSRRKIVARITSGDYDRILVRYISSTGLLWGLPATMRRRIILDFDDILSGSLSDHSPGADPGLRQQLMRSLVRRWIRRYENKCLQFGATLVCSEGDRVKLDDGRHQSPFVVPNVYHGGVNLSSFAGNGFGRPHNLLFVGTLDYPPNIQGLQWFLDSVFPRFRRAYPNGMLTVVGRSPSAQVRALCERTEGALLEADVPDLRLFYREARAVVVPLLAGGGTRIKILEAAAAGRPVLSTPTGAEGLAVCDGRDILIFRDADEFLAKYTCLANRMAYDSLVDAAGQVVTEKYSAQAFEDALNPVLTHMHARIRTAPSRIAKRLVS